MQYSSVILGLRLYTKQYRMVIDRNDTNNLVDKKLEQLVYLFFDQACLSVVLSIKSKCIWWFQKGMNFSRRGSSGELGKWQAVGSRQQAQA